MLNLKWFGHSMWKIWNKDVSVVIDPFTDIGYKMPNNLQADVVISSHDHFDHNNFALVQGNFQKITTVGPHRVKQLEIKGYSVFHDEKEGELRGENIIFLLKFPDTSLVHFGDIGHVPDDSILNDLKNVDIALIPVGGYYTIDHKQAREIVNFINPKAVFPMHYKTKAIDFPINQIDNFLSNSDKIKRANSNLISLTKNDLSENKIIVMDYE